MDNQLSIVLTGIRGSSIPDQSLPHYRGLGACITCNGTPLRGGHLQVGYKPRRDYAHRVAWIQGNGAIPEGLCVLHKCDNAGCINLDHLFLGTRSDNTRDMVNKGRNRYVSGDDCWTRKYPERVLRGESHGRARITEDTVRAIRDMSARGIPQRAIAAKVNVGRGHVHRIVHRQSWAHVS